MEQKEGKILEQNINKINHKLLALIHEFSSSKYFPQFKMVNPRILLLNRNKFIQEPTNSYSQGIFQGLLFENYVSNILILLSINEPKIDWILPIIEDTKKGNKKSLNQFSRQYPLSYTKSGNLCLHREGIPIAEFDSIISYEKLIYIIEMKQNKSNQNLDYRTLEKRFLKFEGFFNQKVQRLIISTTEKMPQILKEKISIDPNYTNIILTNFQKFMDFVDSSNFYKVRWNKSEILKFANLKSLFSHSHNIPQETHNILHDFFLKTVSPDTFWEKNQNRVKFLEKIPIGPISFEDVTFPFNSEGKNNIKSYLDLHTPCILYLSFFGNEVKPSIVICVKNQNRGIRKFRKSKFSWNSLQYKGSILSLAAVSFYYQQSAKIAKIGQIHSINTLDHIFIILRCFELSKKLIPTNFRNKVIIDYTKVDEAEHLNKIFHKIQMITKLLEIKPKQRKKQRNNNSSNRVI